MNRILKLFRPKVELPLDTDTQFWSNAQKLRTKEFKVQIGFGSDITIGVQNNKRNHNGAIILVKDADIFTVYTITGPDQNLSEFYELIGVNGKKYFIHPLLLIDKDNQDDKKFYEGYQITDTNENIIHDVIWAENLYFFEHLYITNNDSEKKQNKDYELMNKYFEQNQIKKGGKSKRFVYFKTKTGKQVKKTLYIINGKQKVRDGKLSNNKPKYVSILTYKKTMGFQFDK